MSAELRLRAVTLQDADLLLEWRNDPVTRMASQETMEIRMDDHLRWLASSLANEKRVLLIAEENDVPVGTVRADGDDAGYALSWTVAPSARGRGVGKAMVALFARRFPGPVRAEVKKENRASARIAEFAGMKLEKEENGVLCYKRGPVDVASVEWSQSPGGNRATNVQIASERFLLRELTLDDVTDQYLGWLEDADARKYISAAVHTDGLLALREYVRQRMGRADVLFLGIFDKETGLHVGNIKYEPVNTDLGYAIMGVLIGERAYRGKGVTTEILKATAAWLKGNRDIKEIVLGVDRDNSGALRAYEKAGFVVGPTPYIQNSADESVTMVWRL